MDKASQSARILAILSDGCFHDGLEFTQLAHPILSYTKIIAILRREGHQIIKERRNKLWKYRLWM